MRQLRSRAHDHVSTSLPDVEREINRAAGLGRDPLELICRWEERAEQRYDQDRTTTLSRDAYVRRYVDRKVACL